MRSPNNNRRSRGRHTRRNNSNQQPMRNTVYDSNGPEVRVRGNASQITEKYLSLARDAASAGDTVKMEACYQYAEHYQRILNTLKEREAAAKATRETREPREQREPRERYDNRRSNDNRHDSRNDNRNDTRNTDTKVAEVKAEPKEATIIEPTDTTINPATNSVDLSETEQPTVDIDIESITASITPEPSEEASGASGEPAKKARPKAAATRKPRTPRAPRAPRTSDLKKTELPKAETAKPENSAEPETKTSTAFEDTPLPGFLSPK